MKSFPQCSWHDENRLELATLMGRRTKNQRTVQLLLGPTTLTVRYLGLEVEDALEIAEQTEV